MAVLIEAISVVVRVDRIVGKLRGGIEAFKRIVPNENFCADGELARVGFMAPNDVKAFVAELEAGGLQYLDDKRQAIDISVVDQRNGPTAECGRPRAGRRCLSGSRHRKRNVCWAHHSHIGLTMRSSGPGGMKSPVKSCAAARAAAEFRC
jgi:hypothetical protein